MKTISSLSIGVCLLIAFETSPGQSYYVTPGGNDNNPGSLGQPWRTLAKAAATLAAGDTVLIMEGVYEERLLPQNSGSPGMYITYTAYPGASVTIDGATIIVPQYAGLVDLAGRQYIRIAGLRIMNSTEAGILADGTSHIILEKNSTYNTGSSGIGIWNSNNILVSENQVELACTKGDQECISVAGTDSFIVRNNVVFDCRKEGICPKDGASNGEVFGNHVHNTDHVGIYVDAWDKHTFNIDVYQNEVQATAQKNGIMLASEQGGLLENVRVFNNISYDNAFDGIGISSCCPGADHHPIRNVLIINNTIFRNGASGWGGGIGVQDNPDIQGVIIRNNICSQNLSFQILVDPIVPPSSVTVDHNLIDGFRNAEGEIHGDAFVEGDPLFSDTTVFDFHLRRNSPAIDAGSPLLAPSLDYDNRIRPSGAGVDIGAFERDASSPVEGINTHIPNYIYLEQNYPNPFSENTTIRFTLSQTGRGSAVTAFLKVFDLLGREVLDLSNQAHDQDEIVVRASQLPRTGLYLYRLSVGWHVETKSMLFIK